MQNVGQLKFQTIIKTSLCSLLYLFSPRKPAFIEETDTHINMEKLKVIYKSSLFYT